MPKRILIVGGVAGGMSAATRLRRLDEHAEIVVFERGPFVSFANCGLPYHIGGEIADRAKLIVQTPERLHTVFNLDIRANTEVLSVQPKEKTVTTAAGPEHYDELILATGTTAAMPDVPGIGLPGHFTLRTIPDLDAILAWIQAKNAKTALVLGGGFIGLEAAEQLHRRGLAVTIIERNPQVLTPLDPEMASHVHAKLKKHGVTVKLQNPATSFDDAGATLQSGERIPADIVIIGVGVKPNTALAKAAGLDIGVSGGILVNAQLRTSDPHIWAVGDAIEVTHGATLAPAVIPLAGPANRQGRIVADNICGLNSQYQGTLGTAIVRVFDLVAGCTGANETLLKKHGIVYEAIHLHPNSHAGYYPGAKSLALKILFAPENGRLLGAQVVGEDGVDKRIDVLATALYAGLTIDDLAELELAYAPPFGSAKDPINLAGMAAQNLLAGLVRVAQWYDVPKLLESGAVIVDVREAAERESGIISGSLSIPLGELRARLGELPKDREILAHCASGQRSYNACRILMQHGFKCWNLTGSYKTWKAAQGVSP